MRRRTPKLEENEMNNNYCSIDDCDNRELPLHWSEFKLVDINGAGDEVICNDCIEELEN